MTEAQGLFLILGAVVVSIGIGQCTGRMSRSEDEVRKLCVMRCGNTRCNPCVPLPCGHIMQPGAGAGELEANR
jgi:hypothetical protein